MEFTPREQHVLRILIEKDGLQSSHIHDALVKKNIEDVSLVTIKRALSDMVAKGIVTTSGAGPSTTYAIAPLGRIFTPIDAHAYCAIEPDRRFGMKSYTFDLFATMPDEIFSDAEQALLETATAGYMQQTEHLSPALEKKELERLIIELSWKSSRIEGNTYTLLDTEKLILENKEAPGHDHQEAQMILNHKHAFTFVREHAADFTTLTRANMERVHAILIEHMNVAKGFREKAVGVTGSVYRPLDNIHQLREGIEALSQTLSRMPSPYAKALITLLGISYLQPFEDGNKRTARLMTNAILLAHQCAPLSYRSVDENEYREAMLVFYELNSIVPFKHIFIGQYEFAAANYSVR